MSNLVIPSKTVLSQREKAIRSIQELYEHVSKLEDSGGGYIKPEEGIPASDMTEEVQESLAKAESALQQHQDISGKEDKMSVVTTTSTNLSCTLGSYYVFSSTVNTLRITLPSPSDNTYVGNVILYFTTGSSPAVTITSSKSIASQTDYAIEAECTYEVNCLYNGSAWVVIAVQIGG